MAFVIRGEILFKRSRKKKYTVQREDGLWEKKRGGEGGKMSPNFWALTHMERIFPLPALPVPSTLPLPKGR